METQQSSLATLLRRAEECGKVNVELYRLKATRKAGAVFSGLLSRVVILVFSAFFLSMLNIGVALWLGQLLGRIYSGFFAVAAFYAVTGLLFYFFRDKWIRRPAGNFLIRKVLN